jgi:hypothetical protein
LLKLGFARTWIVIYRLSGLPGNLLVGNVAHSRRQPPSAKTPGRCTRKDCTLLFNVKAGGSDRRQRCDAEKTLAGADERSRKARRAGSRLGKTDVGNGFTKQDAPRPVISCAKSET